ncbi:MAG: N-methyl-L-tryptophan oxidase [Nitrososphaerales archaeon]
MNTSAGRYEVIVLGAGGMGSAAAFRLARRGRRVLAIDAFAPPHQMGSSHGLTRIIRLAYHEHPSYVPLLRRAYELWRELEQLSQQRLLTITGSLEMGPPGSEAVTGALASCHEHDLPHEMLTAREIMARFPAFHLPADYAGLLQADGGFLDPEGCVAAHLALAQVYGAELHTDERVLDWEAEGDGVRVRTERASYRAERLIVTAGAWLPKLAPHFRQVAVPERQVLAWFRPHRPELFTTANFPVFILETEDAGNGETSGPAWFYGFPLHGLPGLKVARHHHFREAVDPDAFERTPQPRDEAYLRAFATRYFPDGAGETLALMTCLYTNTPDGHFIIDFHPEFPQVVIGGGFSGHGYKFCSLVGEILADLAVHGTTRSDISLFKARRFD